MKQYNGYLYVFTLMVSILLGCTDHNNEIIPDDNKSQGIAEETTVVQLQIRDSSVSTYVSDTEIPATDRETNIHTDLYMYIFNESGVFESFRKESLTPLGNKRWQTQEFEIEKGLKYFYVFVNITDGFIPTPAPNSSNIAFEKTVISGKHTDFWSYANGFKMGTLGRTPTQIHGIGSIGNPELVELKIGRLVAKVGIESVITNNPAVNSDIKGKFNWSETRWDIINLATKIYLVGQWEGEFRKQGSQVISPHYYSYSIPSDITPPNANDYPMQGTGSYFYTMENTNQIPRHENTASFNIRLEYEPDPEEVYNRDTHLNGEVVNLNNGYYGAEFEDGTKLLYSADPAGRVHPTLGPVKDSYFYEHGYCYYKVSLADNTEEAASARYSAIRNHYYLLKIKSVNGLGSHAFQPIPEPEVPLDNAKELEYVLTVKDWTVIDITGEL